MDTFEDIKVGDTVVIASSRAVRTHTRATVDHVTATRFRCGRLTFTKNGREYGTAGDWHYFTAYPATPEMLARCNEQDAIETIKQLTFKIGRAKYTNPVALAEGLRALMVHVEGDE